jgi:hypothetical protein
MLTCIEANIGQNYISTNGDRMEYLNIETVMKVMVSNRFKLINILNEYLVGTPLSLRPLTNSLGH